MLVGFFLNIKKKKKYIIETVSKVTIKEKRTNCESGNHWQNHRENDEKILVLVLLLQWLKVYNPM